VRERAVAQWTRELIDTAIASGGSYYLPYHVVAGEEEFHQACPNADEYFRVKASVDPQAKFRNTLIDRYCPSELCRKRS
jgi:hypothetical protein